MMKLLSFLFGWIPKAVEAAVTVPQHIRLIEYGGSLQGCLRNLEKAAGLPAGDLYIKGEPRRVAAWPSGLRSSLYPVFSKTSDEWEKDPKKKGYICGSILEPDENLLKESRLSFMGSLHISKNCPGVFSQRESDYKSVCTTCGNVEN